MAAHDGRRKELCKQRQRCCTGCRIRSRTCHSALRCGQAQRALLYGCRVSQFDFRISSCRAASIGSVTVASTCSHSKKAGASRCDSATRQQARLSTAAARVTHGLRSGSARRCERLPCALLLFYDVTPRPSLCGRALAPSQLLVLQPARCKHTPTTRTREERVVGRRGAEERHGTSAR